MILYLLFCVAHPSFYGIQYSIFLFFFLARPCSYSIQRQTFHTQALGMLLNLQQTDSYRSTAERVKKPWNNQRGEQKCTWCIMRDIRLKCIYSLERTRTSKLVFVWIRAFKISSTNTWSEKRNMTRWSRMHLVTIKITAKKRNSNNVPMKGHMALIYRCVQ